MRQTVTAIVAILAITVLEITALLQGINGLLLAGAVAVISGIAGYRVKVERDKHQGSRG